MRFGPIAAMMKITVYGNVTWYSWVGGYQCVKKSCPYYQAKRKIYLVERGGKISERWLIIYQTRRRRKQEDDNLQFDRGFVLS
jgi:hypothetical protein